MGLRNTYPPLHIKHHYFSFEKAVNWKGLATPVFPHLAD